MSPRRWLCLLPALAGVAFAAPDVRYTSLRAPDCRTLSVNEQEESSVQRCAGVAGFALLVEEGDLRQSVTVVFPGGRQAPLNFWSLITDAFSFVGDRAEWHLTQGRPSALVVRVLASEDPEHPERHTAYLAVARITPTGACLIARVGPSADMNTRAGALAQRARSLPCLKAP